jgi:hypothetical protein
MVLPAGREAGFPPPAGCVVTAKDVEEELARIGNLLQPLEIVMINTRAGSRYGQNGFLYQLLSAQGARRIRRLDARGGDHR